MTLWQKLKGVARDSVLRNRILFVLGALVVFRVLSAIPIAGVNQEVLANTLAQNQVLGLINLVSGGGLSTLSVVMLGVGPYITSSIMLQLLTMISPKLKTLYHEEGAIGREKFTRLSRRLTIPIALLQGYGFLVYWQNQGVINQLDVFGMITNMVVITAGSMFLLWLGEIITEKGIGNGISLIIFGGIVASIPQTIAQVSFTFTKASIPEYLLFVVVALIVIAGVILTNEAERPIPVTYSRQGGINQQSYMPLRINQAGVMPIIFASSILMFPTLIASVLAKREIGSIAQSFVDAINWFSANAWVYASVYFLFVVLFTYFYTAITFEPDTIATNLQKNGAFVPGVRPGQSTAGYINSIMGRITLIGAVTLGILAVLPTILQQVTGNQALAIGGTSVIIAISVILDIFKKVDGQLAMRQY